MNPEDDIEKEYQQLLFDVKYDREKFKDPETIGLLLFRLARERKAGNLLFKEISTKLDRIAELLDRAPTPQKEEVKAVLADIDQKIISHIRRKGKVDAEDIQTKFGYKGKNAASARLNALFQKRVLEKARAGKKVIYWAKG